MKKNLIGIIIAAILVIGTLVYAFSGSGNLPQVLPSFGGGSMQTLVPAGYDQLLYLEMDEDLRGIAVDSNKAIDASTFGQVLSTIDEVIVYQTMVDENGYNILFIKGNDGFTIEQVEGIGVLAGDEDYEHIDLGKGYWAYGNAESIAWYASKNRSNVSSDDGWKVLVKDLKKSGMNVGFLSTPIADDSGNLLAAQFAETLEYTYFVSAIRKENPEGYLTLQLADDTLEGEVNGITPKLLGGLSKKPLVYLEAEDLLGLFSVDKEQLSTMLPLVLSQRGSAQGIAFDNTDVSVLLDALEKNIALVAYPSPGSPLQAEIHLIFDHKDAYTTLSKLGPVLKGLVGPMLGVTDMNMLKEEITESSLTYSLEIPSIDLGSEEGVENPLAGLGGSFPLLHMEAVGETTILSIFANGTPEQGSDTKETYTYTDNSKVIFGWDAGLMQQTFLQGALEQGGDLIDSNALFQEGSLQGHIDVLSKEQQVRLQFSVEQ